MIGLIIICALGIFSYHCTAIAKDFKGSSAFIKNWSGIIGGIGYLIHIASLVWAFWPYSWWQPILTFVVTILLSGVTAPIFQKHTGGMALSLIAASVLAIYCISMVVGYIIS